MNITHEDFKEQLNRAVYKQKVTDEKEFLKREHDLRNFYNKEIQNREKEHIAQIHKLSEEFKKDIDDENGKKILKYKKAIDIKNKLIVELKNEIRRLRERNKRIERAHVVTNSLRMMLLITIDRLQQYDSVLTNNKLTMMASLNKMSHELEMTINRIKSKEDMINEIMLPDNESDNEELHE